MKKVISFVILAAIMLSILSVSVFAAPALNKYEQKIYDAYTKHTTIDGKDFVLADVYVNYGKNYMLQDGVDITEEQAEKILGYIEEAYSHAGDAHFANTKDGFDKATNQMIIDLAAKASAVIGVDLVVDDGHLIFTEAATNKQIFKTTQTIKPTGEAVSVMPVALVVLMVVMAVAGAVIVKKHA